MSCTTVPTTLKVTVCFLLFVKMSESPQILAGVYYVRAPACAHTHARGRAHARTHRHTRTHTHAHARTHALTHAHTHTHARTHTLTHTNTVMLAAYSRPFNKEIYSVNIMHHFQVRLASATAVFAMASATAVFAMPCRLCPVTG